MDASVLFTRENVFKRATTKKEEKKKEEDLIECRLYALHHVELAKNTGTKDDC